MNTDRRAMKFNGWGWNAQGYDFKGNDRKFYAYLGRELGGDFVSAGNPARALPDITLAASRLKAAQRKELAKVLDPDGLRIDDFERLCHCYGKSLPDLLRVRQGEVAAPPDAVVYPRTEEQVSAVLALAQKRGYAVVPFGGGSSVVGGVESVDPAGRPVITLDTTLMNRLLNLDMESRSATFEAGVYGPALEEQLAPHHLALGHYPQSFEFSTLGGWVAARSSGQQSNHYGDITDLLVCGRMVTPQGTLTSWNGPFSAGGPDTDHLVAGSEGSLGVITRATVQVHPLPKTHAINAVMFPDFERGAATLRDIMGAGLKMSYLRLSDEDETATYLAMGNSHWYQDLGLGALSHVGYGAGRCVMLVGTEGEPDRVEKDIDRALKICRSHRGINLGRSPAKNWHRDRYLHPYLRDDLLDHGVVTETHETSVPWAKLNQVRHKAKTAIRDALAAQGHKCIVMSHLSHSYATGTCIYFIFMYPLNVANPLGQWRPVKTALCEAISTVGGAVSHHHGVGLDHRAWLEAEKGPLALDLIRTVKDRLDPQGIMNPGKLLP